MTKLNSHILKDNSGHRQRSKERLLGSADLSSFDDYELIEIILFYTIPRKDVRPVARILLQQFKSFNAICAAQPEVLREFPLISDNVIILFKALHEIYKRDTRKSLEKESLLLFPRLLEKYLSARLAHLHNEYFIVLYADHSYNLLRNETVFKGETSRVNIYLKEIIQNCTNSKARHILLAHNHPSNNPNPSDEDVALTNAISAALQPLNISIMDHMIVTDNAITSFKRLRIL